MERSIVVEENYQRSDSIPMSKSLGSVIKIDSISIDLVSAMEKNEAEKCEHFSIRGYVAEMRKKDRRTCLPFALDGNNKLEEQTSMLPPLHVAKFRWWRCQNCLQEIGATSAAEEIGLVPNCCKSGFISSSTCSHMQSHGEAGMVLSGVQQAAELDNFEGKKADVNTYTDVNRDEYNFSSCSYKEEMKADIGHTSIIGHENGSEDDGNQEICNSTCDVTKSNPCLIQERRTDGTVALKSKGSGLVESCEPNCGSDEVAVIDPPIENLKCMGSSSAEICQAGKLTSADYQQKNVFMACETPEVVGKIDEAIDAVKVQTTGLPSLELEECDNVTSERDEILTGNSLHDQHHDNPSGLIRRKTRKVRLLTELLGAKGNAENDQISIEGASSNAMAGASSGLGSLSAPHSQGPVEGNLEKGFRGPKRKRKMPRDEDWKPLEMSCPNNVTKKVRVFKEDAETTNIVDFESEEDGFAGVGLQTDTKSQWTKHRIERTPTQSKKKNKDIQVGDGYFPLVPWREVVRQKNQIEIGDVDKCDAVADTGFPKSTHDAFTGKGLQPCFKRYLSPQQTERISSLCKKKNKMPQVEVGQASLMPQRNSMLGEGSITRKDVEIMQTGPEGLKLQSTHDPSARKGLELSLNSYMNVQRPDVNYFAQTEDGIDPLLSQLKGIPREEDHRRKNVMYVGEASVPRKSALDPFFNEGLFCDLNERITHRTSFLREMQHRGPLVEDESFSLHQKLDISGTCNNEKTIDSEVIKKHNDQRADKVFEQGSLDDIMDIVELMAKNQYDRLHEAERNYCLSMRTNDKRNAEIMCFPKVNENRLLGSLQEEGFHMRKPESGNARNGIITTYENVGPTKQNPSNYSSLINRNHFNMGKLEGNAVFPGFSIISEHQEKRSGGVQFSASGSIRNSSTQNCKWDGENVVQRSSPNNMQVLEVCNTCQNGLGQNEEAAEHVRSSMPFGLGIAQSTMEMYSEFPNTLPKGKMVGDMNFLNMSTTNFDKQSAKYPFVCKQRGIELNTKGTGSLDLYPNETIPAMQLLSLMNAGMQSSTPFSVDEKPRYLDKPFSPCDHHPKISVEGKSKFLEKPFLPCDHHSKDFAVLGTELYKASDGSRHSSSPFYGKNYPLEKSCECSPAVPSFASLFQNDGNFKRAAGFIGQVSSKSREEEKAKSRYSPKQNRGRRSQKSVCTNVVSGTSRVQDKQKGFLSASDSVVLPLQYHTIEDSTKRIDLEACAMNGSVWSMKSISKIGICTVNRNPADFSMPESGNVYMISGEDLKFGKKVPSNYRSGLINLDGRKRQRVTKLTAMKEHSQHHVS